MIRWLLLIFLFFLPAIDNAQNLTIIDSLRIKAAQTTNDSTRAITYSDLNYQWAEYNFDSSWHYANQVELIGTKLNNPYLITKGLTSKAIAYDYQNEFDSAIHYYLKAGEYARLHENLEGQASSIFNIGVMHSFKGEMEQAIEKYNESGEIYKKLGNQRMIALVHNNLGIIYRKNGKYELAKRAYQTSLKIKEGLGDESGILNSLTNLSSALRYLKEYDSAILISERALALSQKLQNQSVYLHELVNQAMVHEQLENSVKALNLYNEAESLLNIKTPYETKAQVLNALGQYYYQHGNTLKAQQYVDRMGKVINDEGKLEIAYNFYFLSYQIYKALGKVDLALKQLEKALDKKEKLFDNEVLVKTTELEQLYEKEKREIEIQQLNAENKLQTLTLAKSESERNSLLVISIFVLSLAVLLLFLFRQKRKSLVEKEVLLQEIHHRVKNNLQIISSLLKLQARNLSDEAAIDAVREGESRVKSMALIHQRLYSADDVRGVNVQEYLENLISEIFQTFGVRTIDHQIKTGSIKLDIDTMIPLGLIVNELITNALKYAFEENKKGKLYIEIEEKGEQLWVKVRDDGTGMDSDNLNKSDSFGWKMIQSLSRKLKAEINIINNEGTTVQLVLSRYKLIK
ncbi:histidine kinase dimerization/phosphoacceptor domain -containing protein [Reichenbachiella sp. MALMAid0571]|uniref:tetratricopeptide repeat-containing sensor histidine kinase n=1 Tax=Reichenbachiella sp. MALMAid0571 TaxID=3143939 RepID=UPI0032DF3934